MNDWFDKHNRDEVRDVAWLIVITVAASIAGVSLLAMALKLIF